MLFKEDQMIAACLVYQVFEICMGLRPRMYSDNLSKTLKIGSPLSLVDEPINGDDEAKSISVRSFLQECFGVLGVSVEFSGKEQHERGVVIDRDDVSSIGDFIDLERVKLGQTLIKIGEQECADNLFVIDKELASIAKEIPSLSQDILEEKANIEKQWVMFVATLIVKTYKK